MLAGRLRYCRFRLRGRGGAWLALLGQVIAVVGLPLPPASAKDVSSPFPCQQRVCGCMTASDCWKSCCCFTAGQRVQWAREHDAEVPAELVEDAEEECASCVAPEEEHSESCCTTKETKPPAKPCLWSASVPKPYPTSRRRLPPERNDHFLLPWRMRPGVHRFRARNILRALNGSPRSAVPPRASPPSCLLLSASSRKPHHETAAHCVHPH
jgi:hypothetical protein